MNQSDELQNENAYEELVTVIESSQGTLALLIAVCDSRTLRSQIIDRYERELLPNIYTVRLQLNQKEPSLRAAIDHWLTTNPWVKEQQRPIVLTVTGAEDLLWLNLRSDDEDATQLDKFYGYLQWTREGLREFPYPIVLWVTRRILRTMSRKSPDFWSWRRGVYRFVGDDAVGMQPVGRMPEPARSLPDESDDFGLALADVQELIDQTEAKQGKDAVSLTTLYDRLGQAYVRRIERGEATDLEREKELAIASFQKALGLEERFRLAADRMGTLARLGLFYQSQSLYREAIVFYEQSLKIARELGDHSSEASSLNNLGSAYKLLEQYPQAIEFYKQSLEINRQIGDRNNEAGSLINLGTAYWDLGQSQRAIDFHLQGLAIVRQVGNRDWEANALNGLGVNYHSLGQYPQALEFYQQSLEINRQIGDRHGESTSLHNLGNVYYSFRQYSQAIEFYQQSLEIKRRIGDRNGEASSLYNLARALAKLDNHWQALKNYQQAQQIYEELQLKYWTEQCKISIYELNRVIAAIPRVFPTIDEPKPSIPDWWESSLPNAPPRPRRSQRSWWQKLWQWVQRLFRWRR
jgi:tetratricopeptide (TPR) repeat protein